MKKLLVCAVIAGGLSLPALPAAAKSHCPRGYDWSHGSCVRIHHAPPGYVYGHYYRGHGYWDGHRFWQHHRSHRDTNGQIVIRFY